MTRLKKSLLPVVLSAALLSTMIAPNLGFALTEVQKLQQELQKIQQKEAELKRLEATAEKEIKRLDNEINKTASEVNLLFDQIDVINQKIGKLNEQIELINESLAANEQQKLEAEERIASRDQLLRSRLRLMYMNGVVSYVDVLFNATSFTDFLERLDALKSFIGQDKEMLASNQRDRDLIVAKGKEIEQQKAEQLAILQQQNESKAQLEVKEKEKQVKIASLSRDKQEHEEYSEEVEKEMMAIARQASTKQRQLREAEAAEARKNGTAVKPQVTFAGGKMAYPLEKQVRMTSDYSTRKDPFTGKAANHTGIDFGAPAGTKILAAEDGYVILAGWWSGYGNTVIIDHGNNVWTLYAHIRNNGIKVKKGDYVERGQFIAEVGTTGRSTGNHLHFEVRINEVPVDPKPYLN